MTLSRQVLSLLERFINKIDLSSLLDFSSRFVKELKQGVKYCKRSQNFYYCLGDYIHHSNLGVKFWEYTDSYVWLAFTLSLPKGESVSVNFWIVESKSVAGRYKPQPKSIHIYLLKDEVVKFPERKLLASFLSTLLHELVHYFQHKGNALKKSPVYHLNPIEVEAFAVTYATLAFVYPIIEKQFRNYLSNSTLEQCRKIRNSLVKYGNTYWTYFDEFPCTSRLTRRIVKKALDYLEQFKRATQ